MYLRLETRRSVRILRPAFTLMDFEKSAFEARRPGESRVKTQLQARAILRVPFTER
jgi:hypothetical protein